jgi:hypothetical protein
MDAVPEGGAWTLQAFREHVYQMFDGGRMEGIDFGAILGRECFMLLHASRG